MRRSTVALVLIGLALGGCTQPGHTTSNGAVEEKGEVRHGPTGLQTYTIDMDMPSAEGQSIETAVYFPAKVKVRPGDTLLFENRSTQAPHTVTFGQVPFDTDGPALSTKDGRPNPAVFAPCFSPDAPGKDAEGCPAPVPATPPPYTGSGFWNSGALAPAAAPGQVGGTVALTMAPETEGFLYTYSCLLHRSMAGNIEVVEDETDRPTPAEFTARAEVERSRIERGAATLKEPTFPAGDGVVVAAGWGNELTAFNRFSPASVHVKAGQTVTWKPVNPSVGHTVTFTSPFVSADAPGVFVPGGAASASRYSGGLAHSGLIGLNSFPVGSFSLTFTKPGTYPYVCVLHPGMTGEVVVSP